MAGQCTGGGEHEVASMPTHQSGHQILFLISDRHLGFKVKDTNIHPKYQKLWRQGPRGSTLRHTGTIS